MATLWTVAQPGSSVHGLLQERRILEGVVISFSRGSARPRPSTRVSSVSCIGRQVLYLQHHLGSPHVSILPPNPLPPRLPRNTKQSSLHDIVGPWWGSILKAATRRPRSFSSLAARSADPCPSSSSLAPCPLGNRQRQVTATADHGLILLPAYAQPHTGPSLSG